MLDLGRVCGQRNASSICILDIHRTKLLGRRASIQCMKDAIQDLVADCHKNTMILILLFFYHSKESVNGMERPEVHRETVQASLYALPVPQDFEQISGRFWNLVLTGWLKSAAFSTRVARNFSVSPSLSYPAHQCAV